MSSYYPSFNYMGFNSLKDKNLIVSHFDADQGEVDTFLGMDPIYSETANGNKRIDYGAKYNSVAVIKITVIKANGRDFTVAEVRDFLRWTTGVRKNSYLDLLVGDTIKFSFLGRVTNAYQQKLDARTIGLAIEFTSTSPWAYSAIQSVSCSFGQDIYLNDDGVLHKNSDELQFHITTDDVLYNDGLFEFNNGVISIDNSMAVDINNETDDLYSYIYLDTVFINNNSDYISIKNITLDEETTITNMKANEVITLTSGQFIMSDAPSKLFGDTFNFVWPRLAPGINQFAIEGTGSGTINFTYRYPMKIGDCAIDIITGGGGIDCGVSGGDSIYGIIRWEDIANTPTTISGYGIKDAYTIPEIDDKLGNVAIDEVKLDKMLTDVLGE